MGERDVVIGSLPGVQGDSGMATYGQHNTVHIFATHKDNTIKQKRSRRVRRVQQLYIHAPWSTVVA